MTTTVTVMVIHFSMLQVVRSEKSEKSFAAEYTLSVGGGQYMCVDH